MRRVTLFFCDDCPDPEVCATPENRCDLVKWVAASTAAQGLPLKVTDPDVLDQVRILLGWVRYG